VLQINPKAPYRILHLWSKVLTSFIYIYLSTLCHFKNPANVAILTLAQSLYYNYGTRLVNRCPILYNQVLIGQEDLLQRNRPAIHALVRPCSRRLKTNDSLTSFRWHHKHLTSHVSRETPCRKIVTWLTCNGTSTAMP